MLPVALAVALTVAVVALGVAAVLVRPWRRLRRRRAVVVLQTGRTIEGVLWARTGPLLVLRDAVVHDDAAAVPAPGELVIERDVVEWLQVLP